MRPAAMDSCRSRKRRCSSTCSFSRNFWISCCLACLYFSRIWRQAACPCQPRLAAWALVRTRAGGVAAVQRVGRHACCLHP